MADVERVSFDGVEGIRIGRFPGAINTTVLVYRVGDALIDCGPPNQWKVLRRYVREKPVGRVLLTHHHEDHSGNVRPLQKEFSLPVSAPPQAVGFLAQGYKVHFYRQVVWGKPPLVQVNANPETIQLEGGLRLRPIFSPGHSPDMTCYLEPNRGWLFSGDLFVAALPRYLRSDEDFPKQIESLRRILEHEFDTLFCAHRGVVEKGRQAFRRKLEYLESLRGRARALRGKGRDIREITRQLLGKEDLLSWISGGHFRKSNLIEACLKD